ncbi:MAG: lysylphosphatidylglycerol synthase transmembrane domain-containing protein [Candidatus Spechtbacterales bacterium]
MIRATRKIIPGLILLVLGAFLVGILVVKLDTKELWNTLTGFSPAGFALVVALTFLGIVVANWRAYIILKSQCPDVKFLKLLTIWLAGHPVNYLTPFVYLGGEGIKAYLMKKKMDIPLDKATSTLVFDRILEISASLIMIGVSIGVFISYAGPAGITKTIMSVAVSVLSIAALVMLFYFQVFRNKKLLAPAIIRFGVDSTRAGKFFIKSEQEVVDFFTVNRAVFWKGWGISILKQAVLISRHIALFYFLGKAIGIVPVIVSLGALYAGLAVPIPASLGIQEAFQGISFSAVGLAAGEGVALSFVLRGADILLASVGIAILLRFGVGFMATAASGMLKLKGDK